MVDPSFEVTLGDPSFNDDFAEQLGKINKQYKDFTFEVTFTVDNGELFEVFFRTPRGECLTLVDGGLARMIFEVVGEYCRKEHDVS